MNNEYSIEDLFKMYWNYRALPFPLAVLGRFVKVSNNYDAQAFSKQLMPVQKEVSKLGVNLWDKNNLGKEFFMPIKIDGFLLQNTILSAQCKKNIVETALVGRQGTIKELISAEDWQFSVKGIIASADNNYPEDEVIKLTELFEKNKSLKINNALAAILLKNNEKIVVTSLNLLEVKHPNVQAFEMQFVSDNDFEIIIK